MSSRRTYTHIILEYLNTYPASSIKDISNSTGLSPVIVRKILYKLKNDNYVEKSGNGYVLTERGSRLLEYIASKTIQHRESAEKAQQTPAQLEKLTEEHIKEGEESLPESTLESIADETRLRLDAIEKRLSKIEKEIEELRKALNYLTEPRKESKMLPSPVLSFNDAQAVLGSLFERMLYEGKIVRIGKLIVERSFYDQFKRKFPLKTSDIEKLSDTEKILLEEMRREALVILYAGRELRLVES
ncbi:Rrf2 family transcriptional regulator [Thermosphaera chiliense]|uniref:Rrf2 family transcriptional regulator n=1 Tax=Thermosphaera chiliense TaxID=3402707 RepID=A0A7M1UR63_9CREN|nr:winged helix-turn-helix domain-containing protein [Thermosphaera aggregans]QOR94017.1 Rrf2 family transcriptional regulator [Thermosphaera aggregans]